jgi:hypothetical protein
MHLDRENILAVRLLVHTTPSELALVAGRSFLFIRDFNLSGLLILAHATSR